MKKYLSFLILGASFFVTSCDESLLEQFTPGALTEEVAVQSSEDLAKLMNAAYAGLTPISEIEFNSIFTDEASIGYANGGQGLDDNYAFILNSASDSPNGIWDTHYFVLSRVNRVIKFADNFVPVDAADQMVVDRLKAEAYTLRAHCHIQLITYFSTNPKDRNALGPILANDVYPASFLGVRATNGEVYDLIDSDLATAEALYAGVTGAANPIFANKNFTIGLKARVNNMRGDYANAITFADQVINTSGLSLATFANYPSVFHTDTNPANVEVIFKLKKLTGQTKTGGIWASVNTTLNGSPFFEMGRSLFNVLNTTNLPSATDLQITAIAGTVVTVPGHNLIVGDMFVSTQSRPLNATSANGTSTTPANSLLGGKVYYVKSVTGDNITLTVDPTIAAPLTANFTGANGTGLAIPAKGNYGDIRYTTNVHPTSIIDYNYQTSTDFRNTDKITFRKYPGTATNGLMVNDIKIMRLSEMHLIKAEALVATGNLAGAAVEVNKVQNARSNRLQPLPVYANATEAYKDILNERRLEFIAEGFRFIDLKRLGVVANEGILRDPLDCAVNGACGLPVTDYRFALPIPTDETNANGAILGTQNPGY
ncbi:MAG: RagB/SusD family nutrient uptake outer membrane protein [Bacteroidota bacterium]